MSDTSDFVLPNGFAYFASTITSPGSFAIDQDFISATKKCANRQGYRDGPVFVQVWYAPFERCEIDDFHGGLRYYSKDVPDIIPMGLFRVTRTSISPSKDKRMTCLEWVNESHRLMQQNYQHWLENSKETA